MSPSKVSGYFRGPGGAPHNLYTSTDNIWFQAPPGQPGPPPQQFEYVEVGESFDGNAHDGGPGPDR